MAMRLHFQIDPQSGVPVYRQLMDQIKYYITAGTLQPGGQLPSIREMAQALAVNPTTVVKAYNELAHEKYIEMRHGKGAFVMTNPAPMSESDQQAALRRSARRLAVEATQLGAPLPLIKRILDEEVARLQAEPQSGTNSWAPEITVLTR